MRTSGQWASIMRTTETSIIRTSGQWAGAFTVSLSQSTSCDSGVELRNFPITPSVSLSGSTSSDCRPPPTIIS
ncbi:hypothetical protein EYF80_066080 [Liparis tanakae]|uniref:Uncharacterized protein n=1 Tax=Liparis tanakae TaxID=230148 RepID=A0A4Z2E4W8_9TELE|nr:hypothetical protein EYF80_066080 [Liparis tanakae]